MVANVAADAHGSMKNLIRLRHWKSLSYGPAAMSNAQLPQSCSNKRVAVLRSHLMRTFLRRGDGQVAAKFYYLLREVCVLQPDRAIN